MTLVATTLFLSVSHLLTQVIGAAQCEGDSDRRHCFLPDDDSLRFLVLGDFGGLPVWPYLTLAQSRVARAAAALATAERAHFFAALGDNFYVTGVKNVQDARFAETFEHVYAGSDALDQPWYLLAGNHDHYGNVSAQLAYAQLSARWTFPQLFYSFSYSFGNGTTAEFVVIDTVTLCGNTADMEFAGLFDSLFADYHEPNAPVDERAADAHWLWIARRLNESTADYLFVMGHYPVYSVAEHGPTRCLVDRLLPLLHRHRVTAYLCGHDHTLQHLRHEDGGVSVDYVVSGAASRTDPSTPHAADVPPSTLQFHYPTGGWRFATQTLGLTDGGLVSVRVGPRRARFRFYSGKQRFLYEFTADSRSLL